VQFGTKINWLDWLDFEVESRRSRSLRQRICLTMVTRPNLLSLSPHLFKNAHFAANGYWSTLHRRTPCSYRMLGHYIKRN